MLAKRKTSVFILSPQSREFYMSGNIHKSYFIAERKCTRARLLVGKREKKREREEEISERD